MTRARDVADAGHATTATTADTISQKTSINLSGTYSTHQLLVADAFAFTGDLTVNDHLILGKLSDDGNDFVLEGSHTLQGTGQLEAGYISSSGIGSVDGMTGTLGSGITLGSGATIDSGVTGTLGTGVTFPVGQVIQTQGSHQHTATPVNIISTDLAHIVSVDITPSSTSNKIAIFCTGGAAHYSGGHYFIEANIWFNDVSLLGGDVRISSRDDNQNACTGFGLQYFHSPNTVSSITYALVGKTAVAGAGAYFSECDIIVMEIAG